MPENWRLVRTGGVLPVAWPNLDGAGSWAFVSSTSIIVGPHEFRYAGLVSTDQECGADGSLFGGDSGLPPVYVALWTIARWLVKCRAVLLRNSVRRLSVENKTNCTSHRSAKNKLRRCRSCFENSWVIFTVQSESITQLQLTWWLRLLLSKGTPELANRQTNGVWYFCRKRVCSYRVLSSH